MWGYVVDITISNVIISCLVEVCIIFHFKHFHSHSLSWAISRSMSEVNGSIQLLWEVIASWAEYPRFFWLVSICRASSCSSILIRIIVPCFIISIVWSLSIPNLLYRNVLLLQVYIIHIDQVHSVTSLVSFQQRVDVRSYSGNKICQSNIQFSQYWLMWGLLFWAIVRRQCSSV